jgi:hypothetical protein
VQCRSANANEIVLYLRDERQGRKLRCGGVRCDGWSEGVVAKFGFALREREEVAITATCCLTNNKPHSRLVCHETI